MRCYWKRRGEHVHATFYWDAALLGTLVFRWEEFEYFRTHSPWIVFEMQYPGGKD